LDKADNATNGKQSDGKASGQAQTTNQGQKQKQNPNY
jgi:hypothetical protein